MRNEYCPHGFQTCCICNPPKPWIWTPATRSEGEAYAERCEKRKAWLNEQLATRPDAFPPTRAAWHKELKELS